MRILLVEDESSAARFIAKGLREARHAVDIAPDGTAVAQQWIDSTGPGTTVFAATLPD